jgi:hypothetical protein
LHDRKVCALGLCTLLSVAPSRPHDVLQLANRILASCCLIYENLERVHQERANQAASESESDEYDTDVNELDTDDDEGDDDAKAKKTAAADADELEAEDSDLDDLSNDSDDYDKTVLETYSTCVDENDDLDEFVIFKDTLQRLQTSNLQYYELITSALTPDQCKAIQGFIVTANRRASEIESRKILAQGGYNFTSLAVPANFNFGANQ